MNEAEVIKRIGKSNWKKFCKWMYGQTMGLKDGKPDYYECDVEAFVKKIKTGYDRQADPLAMD